MVANEGKIKEWNRKKEKPRSGMRSRARADRNMTTSTARETKGREAKKIAEKKGKKIGKKDIRQITIKKRDKRGKVNGNLKQQRQRPQ